MFCPGCGKTVGEEQIFCRHCGEKQLSIIAAAESKPDWLKRIGMFSLGAGAFFVCCFAFFFLMWKLGATDSWVPWFLLIASTVLSGIVFLLSSEIKELRKKFDAGRERKPPEIAGRQTAKLLEEKESVPPVWASVVESTTENLVGNKRRTTNELR